MFLSTLCFFTHKRTSVFSNRSTQLLHDRSLSLLALSFRLNVQNSYSFDVINNYHAFSLYTLVHIVYHKNLNHYAPLSDTSLCIFFVILFVTAVKKGSNKTLAHAYSFPRIRFKTRIKYCYRSLTVQEEKAVVSVIDRYVSIV